MSAVVDVLLKNAESQKLVVVSVAKDLSLHRNFWELNLEIVWKALRPKNDD